MSMELDLDTLLKTICPRAFADVAPLGTAKPFVTWQALGGESLGFIDNTAADKRQTLMQVSCWDISRFKALALICEIEAALRASAAFVATPQGEAVSQFEPDTNLYGSIQRYLIWAVR